MRAKLFLFFLASISPLIVLCQAKLGIKGGLNHNFSEVNLKPDQAGYSLYGYEPSIGGQFFLTVTKEINNTLSLNPALGYLLIGAINTGISLSTPTVTHSLTLPVHLKWSFSQHVSLICGPEARYLFYHDQLVQQNKIDMVGNIGLGTNVKKLQLEFIYAHSFIPYYSTDKFSATGNPEGMFHYLNRQVQLNVGYSFKS